MNVRLFTSTYPEIVAGLVLIDSSLEYQTSRIFAAKNETFPKDPLEWKAVQMTGWDRVKAPVGLYRAQVQRQGSWPELSPENQLRDRAWTSVSSFPDATWSEELTFNTLSSDQVSKSRCSFPGSLPVAVLSGGLGINGTCEAMNFTKDSKDCKEWNDDIGITGPLWYSFQESLASLSNASAWEIIWNAGHFIQIEQPDLVTQTIIHTAQRARGRNGDHAPRAPF
jgi:pimeloyl-ACP methyl ester carboxylesterase